MEGEDGEPDAEDVDALGEDGGGGGGRAGEKGFAQLTKGEEDSGELGGREGFGVGRRSSWGGCGALGRGGR